MKKYYEKNEKMNVENKKNKKYSNKIVKSKQIKKY